MQVLSGESAGGAHFFSIARPFFAAVGDTILVCPSLLGSSLFGTPCAHNMGMRFQCAKHDKCSICLIASLLSLLAVTAGGASVAMGADQSVPTTQPAELKSTTQPTTMASTQPTTNKADTDGGGARLAGGGHERTDLLWPDKDTDDDDNLLSKLLASIVVILLLGGIGFVVVRKVLPVMKIRTGGRITVVETAYLTSRKVLHLVSVGSQTFLVGGNRDGVTVITEVQGGSDQAESSLSDPVEVTS